jgi:hypothetical protein
MLKNPVECERDILLAEFTATSCQIFPDLLLGVCWYLPESSGFELGMIRIQMGIHNRSENGRSA